MKIEISLFDAQLNAFFTIVKSFSWANAYAEKCNPQLNAFFTTWAPFWAHFGIVGTVEHCSAAPFGQNSALERILLLKRHLKSLPGKKFPEISR